MITTLSFGAGVQSTTILALIVEGQLPKPNAVIFTDTGWEAPWTYDQARWAKAQCQKADVNWHTVSAGSSIRDDMLQSEVRGTKREGKRWASMPLFTSTDGKSRGMIRRQCTQEYKLRPIQRLQRKLAGITEKRCKYPHVETWIGISLDEVWRMKDSREKWAVNAYPLIDLRMSRWDCIRYLGENGYPVPEKSACIGCPYRSDGEWRKIQETPELWADACEFDRTIRNQSRMRGQMFLHSSLLPLDQVDLRTAEEKGQQSLFNLECEGLCGT